MYVCYCFDSGGVLIQYHTLLWISDTWTFKKDSPDTIMDMRKSNSPEKDVSWIARHLITSLGPEACQTFKADFFLFSFVSFVCMHASFLKVSLWKVLAFSFEDVGTRETNHWKSRKWLISPNCHSMNSPCFLLGHQGILLTPQNSSVSQLFLCTPAAFV